MRKQSRPPRVLLVGGGAREHAIGEALCRHRGAELLVVSHNDNYGLAQIAESFEKWDETDARHITGWAESKRVDMAVIGLEDPLSAGLPDELTKVGIPTVGPCREAARLETSKLFTRDLMRRHGIPGQVDYRYFSDVGQLRDFLNSSHGDFAVKPVGLTAGKGVKVMGVQLRSLQEAIEYAEEVIRKSIGGAAGVVVEERVIGEEFTLQAFVDGETVVPMPLVKDYKLAFEGDKGPNTGSMGSFSQSDGLLPFVTEEEYNYALAILRQIVSALKSEGIKYVGVIYGQFMKTQQGIRLIEINARFGDPEALNVLPLLEHSFVDVCTAITTGTLKQLKLSFARKATVCKYITPPGYGGSPETGVPLSVDTAKISSLGVKVFFAKLDMRNGQLLTTTSRSIALLGIGDSVEEAEERVEEALLKNYVQGRYHVRHDIGKKHLTQRLAQQKVGVRVA